MNTIPVVDLSQYTEGNEADKNKFVHALGTAYEEVGFVAVVNHGIPQTLIKKLYEQVEAFFSLTENQKKQYEKNFIGFHGVGPLDCKLFPNLSYT